MWRGSNRAGDDWHFHIQKLKTQFRIPLAYHEWRFFLYFHLEFSFWMSEQFYSLRYRWCKLQQHIARNKGALKMMEVGTWPRIRNFGCLRGYASNVSGPSSPNTWMNLVEVMSIFKTGNFLVADFVWVTWKPTTSLSTISFWSSFFFSKGWYYNIFNLFFLFTNEMYVSGLFPRRQPLLFFLKIWIPERVWAGGMWRAQAYTSHSMICNDNLNVSIICALLLANKQ